MKKLLPILLMLLAVQALPAQVSVTLINQTGRQLNGLILNQATPVGTIETNSQVTISVSSINVLEGQAYLNLALGQGGKTIPTHLPNVNITHMKKAEQGKYTVTILVETDPKGNSYMVLKPHSIAIR